MLNVLKTGAIVKFKISEFIKKHKWVTTIFWIIVTAIITLGIECSFDKVMPKTPIVVKEISDTIKFVHSYDFSDLNDSLANTHLKKKLENIELAQKYETEISKKGKTIRKANSIMLDASFPNGKGYSSRNAMSYFSFEMSSINEKLIEVNVSFFDDLILDDIYCLTLKIFKIGNNNQRIYYEEQYYNVNGTYNLIRIANSLPKGSFEFCVGFILKRDRMAEYPNTYEVSKIVSKTI